MSEVTVVGSANEVGELVEKWPTVQLRWRPRPLQLCGAVVDAELVLQQKWAVKRHGPAGTQLGFEWIDVPVETSG